MPYPSFETERLILRPTRLEDAAFVLELLNTPKWHQYIGDRGVRSISDAERYIQDRMMPQLERLGFGNYTVITKDSQLKIGSCGLYAREDSDEIDIGFAYLPAFEGKGYAYEAAQRIMQAAQSNFGLRSLRAFTTVNNLSSQKLLRKLGLEHTGMIHLPNDPEELMLFTWKAEAL
jgi:ribosomal-protein-alanine N-acetyltransferase